MRYRYKQTGTIVESSDLLDSAVYIPVTDEELKNTGNETEKTAEEPEEKNTETVRKKPADTKTAQRKRPARTTRK